MDERVFPGLLLLAVLSLATWRDIKTRRIPNLLVLAGMVLGVTLQAVYPRGAGLFAAPSGSIGVLASLGGLTLGLGLLFPLYAMRLLGAGDVKLMAVVGAWLGPAQVAGAIVLTMVAGGLLALGFALATGVLAKVWTNAREMVWKIMVLGVRADGSTPGSAGTTGKLPYALAISAGTALQIYLAGSPGWRMFS